MKKYQQLQTKHELVFPRFAGDMPSSPGDHVQEVRLVKKIKCPKQVYHTTFNLMRQKSQNISEIITKVSL